MLKCKHHVSPHMITLLERQTQPTKTSKKSYHKFEHYLQQILIYPIVSFYKCTQLAKPDVCLWYFSELCTIGDFCEKCTWQSSNKGTSMNIFAYLLPIVQRWDSVQLRLSFASPNWRWVRLLSRQTR
jgi:hypothetical protein